MFNGAEWVVDDKTPSGTIEIWNTNYWEFLLLAGEDFRMRGPWPVQLQDASVGQIVVKGNFVCAAPQLQSIITNVT